MDRNEVIRVLREHRRTLERHGVRHAALFGSLAAFSRNAVTGALTLVETEAVGATAVSVSSSADGAHVYAVNFLGAVATFSRDAGTGALTFVEATIDGPDCAASPSGAFLELPADLFD